MLFLGEDHVYEDMIEAVNMHKNSTYQLDVCGCPPLCHVTMVKTGLNSKTDMCYQTEGSDECSGKPKFCLVPR